MNPLMMMQLMAQMQQGGTQPAQGMGLPSVMPQGQQQNMPLSQNQTQPSFEQMISSQQDIDPMTQLMAMQPQSSSILDEGALSAIKSAKTALKMDDEEKNRALGMGLVKLFAGMAKPGYGDGLNGALSALTQNMPSAVDAYTGEEGRVQNINAALLNHVSQMRAKQQEAWMNTVDKAREREYKNKTLTETERHNKQMEENTKSSHDETSRYHDLWLSDKQEQAENKMTDKKIQRLDNRLKDKKYEAAESELNALIEAEGLLKKGDPLRGKMWSFIEDKLWKKPEFLKGADESKFEISQSDMKGHAFKRFGFRNIAEFKGLKEVDPLKGRKANLGIVETRKKQLLPIIKQKMALEAQKEALETGEDWRPILTQNWNTFLRSLQQPSPEKSGTPKDKGRPTPPTQKSVSMKDQDGNPLVVPSEDVDEVLALGGSYAR